MKSRMRLQRGIADAAPCEFVELGPEVAERMTLTEEPDAATVAGFGLTGGASRAWDAINAQLDQPQGALFWIGGPAGAGKTHFLNYVIALSARAGAMPAESGRYLTLAVDAAQGVRPAEIDRRILELIAHTLAGENHAAALWREMRGAEALTIACEAARRQGVRGLTIAIDLGPHGTETALENLTAIAQVARMLKHLRLVVVAAGRGDAPAAARAFNVAAAPDEAIAVAMGRARRLDDAGLQAVEALYRNLDCGLWEPRTIYPLHPVAAATVAALAAPAAAVGPLAAMMRELIGPWREARTFNRLVMPAALMKAAAISGAVSARLGDSGRAALKIAYAAADAAAIGEGRETARAVVEILVLDFVAARPAGALGLGELRTRMGPAIGEGARGGAMAMGDLLAAIAARAGGIIAYDAAARTAAFNPRGAGAPEVAAFNAALTLIRRFDATLTPAHERPELNAKLKRLGDAIASALEGAYRNREVLAAALRESGAVLLSVQQKAFADFIELAEGGADLLIERGADQPRREAALAIVADYEALAIVAGAVPRLKLMREYLAATRLNPLDDDDPSRDRRLAALELESQLLTVAVNPAVLAGAGRNLDALEARFQKFKWTYVQFYRTAHEQWRLELERLAPIADDTRRHLQALGRLNAIAALGAPEGAGLAVSMAQLEGRLVRCDLDAPLSPEITPCCPRCGFVLGTVSPREELKDLFEQARRTLEVKLGALSHSAIARLIAQHDRNHRLEGFLKITQAAQTDALIRVLDDQLARYLARLLDENRNAGEAAIDSGAQRPAVQPLRAQRLRRAKLGGRGGRTVKLPPDGL